MHGEHVVWVFNILCFNVFIYFEINYFIFNFDVIIFIFLFNMYAFILFIFTYLLFFSFVFRQLAWYRERERDKGGLRCGRVVLGLKTALVIKDRKAT